MVYLLRELFELKPHLYCNKITLKCSLMKINFSSAAQMQTVTGKRKHGARKKNYFYSSDTLFSRRTGAPAYCYITTKQHPLVYLAAERHTTLQSVENHICHLVASQHDGLPPLILSFSVLLSSPLPPLQSRQSEESEGRVI